MSGLVGPCQIGLLRRPLLSRSLSTATALRPQDHIVTFDEGTWHELCFAAFVSGEEVAIENDAAPRGQATSCPHRLKFTSLDLQDRLSLELFIAVAFSGKGGAGEVVVKEVRPRP